MLLKFFALFALIYAAFGLQSPFFPRFLQERGLDPTVIGLALAVSTGLRLLAAPVAGRIADRTAALARVLAVCTAGSALAIGLYPLAGSPAAIWPLLIGHALVLGPVAPLADAFALRPGSHRLAYAPVRGAGSAAFIAGLLAAGVLVERAGLSAVFVASAGLSTLAALLIHLGLRAPPAASRAPAVPDRKALAILVAIPAYRRLLITAALVLGSHALHDGFSMIRWAKAGLSPTLASVLWSLAVIPEVLVFFVVGPPLLRRLGVRGACMLAAAAGVLRWTVMAVSVSPLLIGLVQPLHGLTFALFHLAAMRLIQRTVPPALAATGQGLYATFGAGLASMAMTLTAGGLYAHFGGQAFWFMAGLCALAIVMASSLKEA